MSFTKTLSRNEMKNIKAGARDAQSGSCRQDLGCHHKCDQKIDGEWTCSTCCLAKN